MKSRSVLTALACAAGLPAALPAQTTFPEVEPNDAKAQANVFSLAPGDAIQGVATGNSTTVAGPASADYFLVSTPPAQAGIYRHRLLFTITGSAGHSVTLRGLSQLGGVVGTGDVSVQDASAATVPGRYVQWYGFGRSEQVYYRVTGNAGTTGTYRATLDTAPIAPADLGTFPGGLVTITSLGQGHASNTDLWVYDDHFDPIPGFGNNDEPAPGTTSHAKLTRDFPGGVYYLAISTSNLANNQASPEDDRNDSGAVLDFPGAAAGGVVTTAQDISFVITDGAGADHPVAASKGSFEVAWFRFTLTQPATGACCLPDGSCSDGSPGHCDSLGGAYQGNGTACGGVPCPQPPTGACCHADASCTEVSSFACAAAGGAWSGANTVCSTNLCPHRLPTSFPSNSLMNNGGCFMDLTASTDLAVRRFDFHSRANAGNAISVDIWTYPGSYVGHDGDPAGWALHETIDTVSLGSGPVVTPLVLSRPLVLNAAQTTGVYMVGRIGGLWFQDIGATTFSDAHLHFFGDTARGAPWADPVFTPRIWSGTIYYTLGAPECYANCDGSTSVPVLNVADFTCFLQRFAGMDPYANCDQSTSPPTLNVADFTCFLQKFAAACP